MTSPFFYVMPGHDLAYNEIVKPARRWAFSYYYLYRWLPLLHPQQAMLVQVLRQSTWQNGRPTGQCQLANATLCRMLGWSESSHKSLLAELERPYSDWFVRRERTRKRHVTEGHAVEGAPRYRVTMDEPLTPRDQAALRAWLGSSHPSTPYEAAEILEKLAAQRSRELWTLLDAQPVPDLLPLRPATVADLARAAWSHMEPGALEQSRPFVETAERCQLRITGAGYAHMELDYLLRSWLAELGINNSWLVIALRARCFHDPQSGESRDIVTLGRRELEEQLGLPDRTFRRLLRDELTFPLFHISPAGAEADPTRPRVIPHRGELAFHIAYPLLPVAPVDRPRYEALLMGESLPADAAATIEKSTSGQRTRLKVARAPVSPAAIVHEAAPDPAEPGQPTQLSFDLAARQPSSERPANPARPVESGHSTPLKPANPPTILKAVQSEKPENQQEPIPPTTLGKGGEGETAIIRKLLEPFRIQGISRILQKSDLTAAEVRGWIFRGREEVDIAQMGGYLFRRLCATPEQATWEPLPELYALAGAVDEDEAARFESWWLDELSPPPFENLTQRARYGAWLQIVKQESGNPDRPDYSPHARWRREMARGQMWTG